MKKLKIITRVILGLFNLCIQRKGNEAKKNDIYKMFQDLLYLVHNEPVCENSIKIRNLKNFRFFKKDARSRKRAYFVFHKFIFQLSQQRGYFLVSIETLCQIFIDGFIHPVF